MCKKIAAALVTVVLSVGSSRALAQSGPAVRVHPTKTAPTLPILYRAFLGYQLHLEKRADELKAEGKNGEDFRTHYQKVLGFSDQEFAKVHQSAVHLNQVLQAKDKEIHNVIVTARAALPKEPVSPGTILPGPPQQLKDLFAERKALIDTEIAALDRQLTPEDVTKLENFLQKDFAPAVTVGNLPPHTQATWLLPKGASR